MSEVNVTRTVTADRTARPSLVQQEVVTSSDVAPEDFGLAKLSQVIWYIGHFIAIILGLRFVFLLLGANLRGIVLFIYNISAIFVAPFRGIFPSPAVEGAYFDSAALLAIIIYYLIVFLVVKGIWLLSRNNVENEA